MQIDGIMPDNFVIEKAEDSPFKLWYSVGWGYSQFRDLLVADSNDDIVTLNPPPLIKITGGSTIMLKIAVLNPFKSIHSNSIVTKYLGLTKSHWWRILKDLII